MIPLRTLAAASSCAGNRSFSKVGMTVGNDPHNDRTASALNENVDSEPCHPRQSVRHIAIALLAKSIDGLLVRADQVGSDAPRVVCGKHTHSWDLDSAELSVNFNLRHASRRKDQIAHFFRGAQHSGEQDRSGNRALSGRPSNETAIGEFPVAAIGKHSQYSKFDATGEKRPIAAGKLCLECTLIALESEGQVGHRPP